MAEFGNAEVADQGFVGGVYDREVCVVALEGCDERLVDWGLRRGGEGGWRVEVFYCCLEVCEHRTGATMYRLTRTPRYLLAQGEFVEVCEETEGDAVAGTGDGAIEAISKEVVRSLVYL